VDCVGSGKQACGEASQTPTGGTAAKIVGQYRVFRGSAVASNNLTTCGVLTEITKAVLGAVSKVRKELSRRKEEKAFTFLGDKQLNPQRGETLHLFSVIIMIVSVLATAPLLTCSLF
jgi:hypothetical protein